MHNDEDQEPSASDGQAANRKRVTRAAGGARGSTAGRRVRQPRRGGGDKMARLAQVNRLLQVISNHGRRFFYNQKHNRVARMLIGATGHLYFVDDYSDKAIYVAYKGHWDGWSHGGTLRDLVRAMADYVRDGVQLSLHWIGPQRQDGSNIWGYTETEIVKCRAAALETGVMCEPEGQA